MGRHIRFAQMLRLVLAGDIGGLIAEVGVEGHVALAERIAAQGLVGVGEVGQSPGSVGHWQKQPTAMVLLALTGRPALRASRIGSMKLLLELQVRPSL